MRWFAGLLIGLFWWTPSACAVGWNFLLDDLAAVAPGDAVSITGVLTNDSDGSYAGEQFVANIGTTALAWPWPDGTPVQHWLGLWTFAPVAEPFANLTLAPGQSAPITFGTLIPTPDEIAATFYVGEIRIDGPEPTFNRYHPFAVLVTDDPPATATPEPASLLLLGVGVSAIVMRRSRWRCFARQ